MQSRTRQNGFQQVSKALLFSVISRFDAFQLSSSVWSRACSLSVAFLKFPCYVVLAACVPLLRCFGSVWGLFGTCAIVLAATDLPGPGFCGSLGKGGHLRARACCLSRRSKRLCVA